MDYIIPVYYGLGAAGWSLMRYYYSVMGDKKVSFEGKRLVKTILIGFGVGVYVAYTGQEASPQIFQAVLESGSAGLKITAVVDSAVNFALRLWKNYK